MPARRRAVVRLAAGVRSVTGRKPVEAARLRLSNSKNINPTQVRTLFRAAGWTEDLSRYSLPQIQKVLRHSHLVLSAWEGKKLVGLASAVSDGVLCGMVQNLVVHPGHRRRGLGTRLLKELARIIDRQGVSHLYALGTTGEAARRFYGPIGFRALDWKVFVRLTR